MNVCLWWVLFIVR